MFLDEPHRAGRYFSTLLKEIGERIFAEDHRLEMYYVSAYAQYKLEYFFRSRALDGGVEACSIPPSHGAPTRGHRGEPSAVQFKRDWPDLRFPADEGGAIAAFEALAAAAEERAWLSPGRAATA
jgi:hypothetical protein